MAQNSRPAFRSPSLEQETVEELSRRLLDSSSTAGNHRAAKCQQSLPAAPATGTYGNAGQSLP